MARKIGVIAQMLDFLAYDAIVQQSTLGNPRTAPATRILVRARNGAAGTTLVVTGGLKTILQELHPAVRDDCANQCL